MLLDCLFTPRSRCCCCCRLFPCIAVAAVCFCFPWLFLSFHRCRRLLITVTAVAVMYRCHRVCRCCIYRVLSPQLLPSLTSYRCCRRFTKMLPSVHRCCRNLSLLPRLPLYMPFVLPQLPSLTSYIPLLQSCYRCFHFVTAITALPYSWCCYCCYYATDFDVFVALLPSYRCFPIFYAVTVVPYFNLPLLLPLLLCIPGIGKVYEELRIVAGRRNPYR